MIFFFNKLNSVIAVMYLNWLVDTKAEPRMNHDILGKNLVPLKPAANSSLISTVPGVHREFLQLSSDLSPLFNIIDLIYVYVSKKTA